MQLVKLKFSPGSACNSSFIYFEDSTSASVTEPKDNVYLMEFLSRSDVNCAFIDSPSQTRLFCPDTKSVKPFPVITDDEVTSALTCKYKPSGCRQACFLCTRAIPVYICQFNIACQSN